MELSNEQIDAVFALLRDFPANGRPSHDEALMHARALGLVAEHNTTAPCRACGTRRPDYHYYRPTPAGRALLAYFSREPAQ